MVNQNKKIAHAMLRLAIQHPYSESAINQYIRFMDGLSRNERRKILLDPTTTRLVNQINRRTEGEIRLRKIHMGK
jgi:hypothetical protein